MAEVRNVDIAIVGGGPAGGALAARLAASGHDVRVFERWPEPRWRAAGVYSSPQTRRALLELGVPAAQVGALLRPVSELVVETVDGVSCTLAHRAAGPAVGVDRVRLERVLLDRARELGATIHEGAIVRAIDWRGGVGGAVLRVSEDTGDSLWRARLVVGADGPRSLVARSAGVALPTAPVARAGMTVHAREIDPRPGEPAPARLVFGRGWYCGTTPVPHDRINIGIVMTTAELRRRLSRHGSALGVVRAIQQEAAGRVTNQLTDEVKVAYPLAHRVRRLSGRGFLLVGDAAGFVDPVTGEGLYRAFLTAERAAEAIDRWRSGDKHALDGYDRALRARFARKDAISWLLQLFMLRPALLAYGLRRLQRRDQLRRTFGLVMSDLAPPEQALNARFLAALLAP